jgi:hypothetical protein
MGIGLGVGINRSNYAQGIFGAYQSRVIADGGVTEAGGCVDAGATALLQTASLLLIPSGYKANKLYSQIPTSGAGDFVFTRASDATRVNQSGVIETMGSNIPRLDYTFASCPMAIMETQRTNLVFPSATATTQTRTVTATQHTLSFYGTGTVVLSGVAIATLNGTGANNRVSLVFTPTAGSLILTVTGTVTNWQLEAGNFPSTLIPTTSASATRLMDQCAISSASSLIGQSEGTLFFEIYFTQITSAGFRILCDLEGNVANQFSGIIIGTTNNGNDISYAGLNYSLTTGRHKIVCTYSQTNNQRKLFVDGVLRSTSTHTNFLATIERISLGCRLNPFSGFSIDRQYNSGNGIFDFAVFNSLLTDAQCVALTTL